MDLNDDIETAMLHYMHLHRICAMEELFRNLPAFTTNQLFLAVDRLSREGKVLLRYQNRSEYVILRGEVARRLSPEMSGATTETGK